MNGKRSLSRKENSLRNSATECRKLCNCSASCCYRVWSNLSFSGMTHRLTVLVIALSSALACTTGTGSSLTGTATVTGTLNGLPFAAADANSATVVVPIPGTNTTSANSGLVTIASASGLCQDANANLEPKSTKYLFLAFTDQDLTTQTSPPTAPGVYSIFTGTQTSKLALAVYAQSDPNCRAVPGAAENATDGTITLTAVNGGTFSGTFVLTMTGLGAAPADHITCQFSAPFGYDSALFVNQNKTTSSFLRAEVD